MVRIRLAIGCAVLVLAAAAATATGAVSTGHSSWVWASPQPQGNTLTGLDFAGNRGYAAGAFGTLLRTDDAGANWTGVNTGLTDPLARVRVINANTVVVGGGCALRRSDDGGNSFSRLPWTASDESCPSPIVSFHFPSPSVGYLVIRDGSVFKTTDGGQTFSRQTSVPGSASAGGSREPTDIFFTSATEGVAVTGPGGAKVFRTTDSGNSWVDVASPAQFLRGVTFVDALNGVAVGHGKTMLTTDDGGVTWDPQPLAGAPVQDLTGVDCTSATTCLMTESNGHLLRTTDGGATGAEITPATSRILAASFSSPTRVVAVGEGGTTVTSDDGGVNYAPLGGAVSANALQRLRATSSSVANVGAANGTLLRTTDGGFNWSSVGVPTTATVLDASFPTTSTGFAIDSLGVAFKTVNGGSSWQILNTGTTDLPTAVYAPSPDIVLLSGGFGIRRSTNGGATFDPVTDSDLARARLANILPAGNTILAYGGKALRVSNDNGNGWQTVPLPKKTRVLDASFFSDRAGFILTTKRQLLRTRNAGKTWVDNPAIATNSAYGISFASPSEGFVLANGLGTQVQFGANGLVMHTTDAGASWQPQLLGPDAVADIWDTGPTALAVTSTSQFFVTSNGGQSGTPSELTLKQVAQNAKKGGKVQVAGTLEPAEGGEQILVMYRDNGRWRGRVEVAASNGQFSSAFKIKRQTVAVAQWLGDDTRSGDGSTAVRVRPPKKK